MKPPTLLSLLAIASVIVVITVMLGYFSELAFQCVHVGGQPAPVRSFFQCIVGDGVVEGSLEVDQSVAYSGSGRRSGTHFTGSLNYRRRIPRLSWLLGFRVNVISGSMFYYEMDMPIWCVVLPCSIPPCLWYRRRQRTKKGSRGFEIKMA